MFNCRRCGGATDGYKCDKCGYEMKERDIKHSCGDKHCLSKCQACGQAESDCKCQG